MTQRQAKREQYYKEKLARKPRKPRPPKRFNKVGIPIEGERQERIRVLPGEGN